MTSIDFRSGWLCAAPKDPPTWKMAIASALTHTGALDLDLIRRTVPPTADHVVGLTTQRHLRPATYSKSGHRVIFASLCVCNRRTAGGSVGYKRLVRRGEGALIPKLAALGHMAHFTRREISVCFARTSGRTSRRLCAGKIEGGKS